MKRIGLVGIGDAGNLHAKALHRLHHEGALQWTCVVARDASKAKVFLDRYPFSQPLLVYSSLQELLNAGGVDAVILATPDGLHTEQTILCATSGVHILVEKPLGLDITSATMAVEQAKSLE